MLEEVGITTEITSGFIQTAYRKDEFEILLSRISKDTGLQEHSHAFSQFGFCFDGSFMFCLEDREERLEAGQYYLLDGDIPHSAKANEEDFYALDFKFLSSETFIRQGVKDYTIDCGSLNKVSICQHSFLSMESNTVFTLEPDSRRQYFLALRQEASIQFNDETHRLTPMHIYRIEAKSPLRIRTFEDGAYLVNYFSV